jgi:acyl-CoA synthetase (AMP-forming)/AMP-acid ligase II
MTSLFERFEQNAARHPDKAAFVIASARRAAISTNWKTLTYIQLLDATRGFASALQALDVHPGMRAALMTPVDADFFPLALALLKLGIVPIVLDPAIGIKKIGELLNQSQPDIFIGNLFTGFLQKILKWGKLSTKIYTSIEGLLRTKTPVIHSNSQVYPQPQSPAAIIFTSGSTGTPKGVLYTQENLSAQLDLLAATFHITPDEIDLPAFPLYALIDVLLGVTSVIPDITFPVPGKINPARTLAAIQNFHVTNTFASPVVLDRLADYGIRHNIKLPSLRRVITAGAPAPTHLQQRFRKLLNDQTDLFGVYGATEALPIAIIESRAIFADAQSKTEQGAGICLGKPVEGCEVGIIEITDAAIQRFSDSTIQRFSESAKQRGSESASQRVSEAAKQRVNGVGEITVKGKAVTKSYFMREDANRLAKMSDGDEIVHRMGDLGYFDEQGRLWYCGRKSHRVITKDGVLFTEQIEGIFNAHPLVYRSALVGVAGEPVLWIELEKHARHADRKKIIRELLEISTKHPQAGKITQFRFAKKFLTDIRHNSKIIREELAKW